MFVLLLSMIQQWYNMKAGPVDQRERESYTIKGAAMTRESLLLRSFGQKNLKSAPAPGCDSTQILPPWSSIIFFTIANPTPVLSISSRRFSVWKMTNIFSWYLGSMPGPLSFTEKIHPSLQGSQPMVISAMDLSQYLMALLTRLVNTWLSLVR